MTHLRHIAKALLLCYIFTIISCGISSSSRVKRQFGPPPIVKIIKKTIIRDGPSFGGPRGYGGLGGYGGPGGYGGRGGYGGPGGYGGRGGYGGPGGYGGRGGYGGFGGYHHGAPGGFGYGGSPYGDRFGAYGGRPASTTIIRKEIIRPGK